MVPVPNIRGAAAASPPTHLVGSIMATPQDCEACGLTPEQERHPNIHSGVWPQASVAQSTTCKALQVAQLARGLAASCHGTQFTAAAGAESRTGLSMLLACLQTYEIDAGAAEKPVEQYATLQEFFTRRLTPGLRPIAAERWAGTANVTRGCCLGP